LVLFRAACDGGRGTSLPPAGYMFASGMDARLLRGLPPQRPAGDASIFGAGGWTATAWRCRARWHFAPCSPGTGLSRPAGIRGTGRGRLRSRIGGAWLFFFPCRGMLCVRAVTVEGQRQVGSPIRKLRTKAAVGVPGEELGRAGAMRLKVVGQPWDGVLVGMSGLPFRTGERYRLGLAEGMREGAPVANDPPEMNEAVGATGSRSNHSPVGRGSW
jgi:hypothetical protein